MHISHFKNARRVIADSSNAETAHGGSAIRHSGAEDAADRNYGAEPRCASQADPRQEYEAVKTRRNVHLPPLEAYRIHTNQI